LHRFAQGAKHFGDSFTDPGNRPFEPSPAPETVANAEDPIGSSGLVFQFRNLIPEALSSNGQNWAYFVAKDLGLDYQKGSEINHISSKKGKYINFAFHGASQDTNTSIALSYPGAPPNFLSFIMEIENFKNLLDAPDTTISISPDDVFMYDNLGGNDCGLTEFLLLFGAIAPSAIPSRAATYATYTIQNLTNLYNCGMRKVFISKFDTPYSLYHAATIKGAVQYGLNNSITSQEALDLFESIIVTFQDTLQPELDTFRAAHPDLDMIEMSYHDHNFLKYQRMLPKLLQEWFGNLVTIEIYGDNLYNFKK
jgi:hypothetical protein